jgi:hypothetical protein
MILLAVFLRIEIAAREEQCLIIKFFLGEGHVRFERYQRSDIYYQEDAMKKSAF